jgi:hypothetical protein
VIHRVLGSGRKEPSEEIHSSDGHTDAEKNASEDAL